MTSHRWDDDETTDDHSSMTTTCNSHELTNTRNTDLNSTRQSDLNSTRQSDLRQPQYVNNQIIVSLKQFFFRCLVFFFALFCLVKNVVIFQYFHRLEL